MKTFNYGALEGLIPLLGGIYILLISLGYIQTTSDYLKNYGFLMKWIGPALIIFGLALLSRLFN